jgi:hypothetical protein
VVVPVATLAVVKGKGVVKGAIVHFYSIFWFGLFFRCPVNLLSSLSDFPAAHGINIVFSLDPESARQLHPTVLAGISW